MFGRIADRYRDQVVVIVGAGGIGAEIARLVAPLARKVVAADYGAESLARLAEFVPAEKLVARTLDVRDAAAVQRFADESQALAGPADFLFYAAGILTIEPFLETSPEAWRRAVDVNLNGAFYCTQAIAKQMAARRSGSILLLGSIAGMRARSGSRVNPVYNATKAGLSALVNGTAMQLRPYGIRINCISPGPTATPMMDVQPAQVHAAVREITVDQRLNEPSEIAELALFVAGHGRFTGEDVGMGGGAGLGG